MNDDGEIKFRQVFHEAAPPRATHLLELRDWRDRLRQWDLIGVYADGTGYGNLSHRFSTRGPLAFVITGTQTGGRDFLEQRAYTTVLDFDVGRNTVIAEGEVRASSESMTHGVIYELHPAARYVFHVHSPEIWRFRKHLGLLETAADVPYGTPEMADEVRRLFAETDLDRRKLFAMAGHQDGLISFGSSAIEAGSTLRGFLTRARELS